MTKDELIQYLESTDEDEVFIKIDNTLYDFTFENVPEQFDGFDTVFPAALALVASTEQ